MLPLHLLSPLSPFLTILPHLYYSRRFLSNHSFHCLIHFLALFSFFATTWGSSRTGTLSEWVCAFFRRPTFFSFSLAAFFPYFRRFRHPLCFLSPHSPLSLPLIPFFSYFHLFPPCLCNLFYLNFYYILT
jgi:hypothetical protein